MTINLIQPGVDLNWCCLESQLHQLQNETFAFLTITTLILPWYDLLWQNIKFHLDMNGNDTTSDCHCCVISTSCSDNVTYKYIKSALHLQCIEKKEVTMSPGNTMKTNTLDNNSFKAEQRRNMLQWQCHLGTQLKTNTLDNNSLKGEQRRNMYGYFPEFLNSMLTYFQ